MKNSEQQVFNEMEIESCLKNISLNKKEIESRVRSTIVLFLTAVSIFGVLYLSSKLVQYAGQLSLLVFIVSCLIFYLIVEN